MVIYLRENHKDNKDHLINVVEILKLIETYNQAPDINLLVTITKQAE